MVEAALNVAAEQVIEWDASRAALVRNGVRDNFAAPQGAYRCAGDDRWVAISVVSDEQWLSLAQLLGIAPKTPAPSVPPAAWDRAEGRRADHDRIDGLIEAWCETRQAEEIADTLCAAGVPAAVVIGGRDIVANPQMRHRGLFEVEDHPVTGRHEIPVLPFRFEGVESWLRNPSPLLGQHNLEVLGEVADDNELAALRAAGVIGDRLAGY